MDQDNHEKGYALITVLLIITIFMILFLSFAGQASTSVKQNRVVEKSNQSTAIAEMGISYYQVAVQNIFESNQQKVTDQVNTLINGGSTEDFITLATKSMKDILKQELLKEPSQITIDGHPSAYFSITNIDTNIIPSTNKINISFSVNGTEDNKMTPLDANMTIDLGTIIKGDDSTINYVLPAFNEVPIPNPGCTSFENGCSEVLLSSTSGSQTILFPSKGNGNSNNLSDKTVYSKGPGMLSIDGNANNSYHLKIHADGPISIDKNMNHATKLTIETSGSMTINGNFKVTESSRILIKDNLIAPQKHLELDNSFVFVGKDATVDMLSLTSKSTMCVQGNLTVNSKSVDPSSSLFVLGMINGTPSNVTQSDFNAKCGKVLSQDLTINWGQKILAKIENVNYK
jgi:competence protein ComGC